MVVISGVTLIWGRRGRSGGGGRGVRVAWWQQGSISKRFQEAPLVSTIHVRTPNKSTHPCTCDYTI